MIREEIAQLDTRAPNLRRFGLVVGGVFALLGAWFWWRGNAIAPWFLSPGGALIVLGTIFPSSLRKIYIGWMSLAFTLGLVVSTILLGVFFYLVITPVGLGAKLLGKDFLSKRWQPDRTTSYWIPRAPSQPASRQEYERQF